MGEPEVLTYTAFIGNSLFAHGDLSEVTIAMKRKLKSIPVAQIMVFSDSTGKQMDLDIRGSEKEILTRLEVFISQETSVKATGPGRPKLGVVTREISLLPRHWEWLSTQTGGASATLRRLVEEARKGSSGKEQVKQAQERTYKFMTALAGDLPNYEEVLRALFAKDKKKFKQQMSDWPPDIKTHALRLSTPAFE